MYASATGIAYSSCLRLRQDPVRLFVRSSTTVCCSRTQTPTRHSLPGQHCKLCAQRVAQSTTTTQKTTVSCRQGMFRGEGASSSSALPVECAAPHHHHHHHASSSSRLRENVPTSLLVGCPVRGLHSSVLTCASCNNHLGPKVSLILHTIRLRWESSEQP